MEDVKGIIASRTVWMGILALVGVLANAAGYTFAPADQAALVDAISNIMTTVGAVGAIYFRVKATKVIGKA